MGFNWNITDYGSITIADTAGTLFTLADAGMPTTMPSATKSFTGFLETAAIRARGDGTAPTTTEGQLINVGDEIILSESEIRRMQFVRTGATSGVIKGHYSTAEPSEVT